MTENEQMDMLELKWVMPDEIDDNPLNWREHPPAQRDALAELIFEGEGKVGWAGAGLVNDRREEDGWLAILAKPTLIDGHERKDLALERNEPMPVLVGRWTPEQEKRILATLDPITAMAMVNAELYGELLEDIGELDEDMIEIIDTIMEETGGFRPVDVEMDEVGITFAEDDAVVPATNMLPIEQVVPNNYSAHAMTSVEQERMVKSVEEVGIIVPIIVRNVGDKFEIIDGMQRYKAAKACGLHEVPVENKGPLSDTDAKLVHVAVNKLHGKFVPSRIAPVLEDIREELGDKKTTKATGLSKPRMDSFGKKSGYGYKVDDEGVLERTYKEYGPDDYKPIGEKITLMIAMPGDKYPIVEDVLNSISPNWAISIITMAEYWKTDGHTS